jgi:hypothetical protein
MHGTMVLSVLDLESSPCRVDDRVLFSLLALAASFVATLSELPSNLTYIQIQRSKCNNARRGEGPFGYHGYSQAPVNSGYSRVFQEQPEARTLAHESYC